ncbi:FtsX-like permease family protein [Candidatus Thorarchaeota archaeon]|nr:MAG: FtsX-like permease family protein [Candidatus Thorarchaeota archaeon]
MTALQVGYGALGSSRRKVVTLICLMLSSSLAAAITVYVDSYSMHKWDEVLDIGPVAMEVGGAGVELIADDVAQIEGVTATAAYTTAAASITSIVSEEQIATILGDVVGFSSTLMQEFGDLFTLQAGSFPQASDEIVLGVGLADYLGVGIGDLVNYTHGESLWRDPSYAMTVVGLWNKQGSGGSSFHYGWEMAIVPDSMLDPRTDRTFLWIDVDRSRVTPFNVQGSLDYLLSIQDSIRRLDPTYDPERGIGSRYWVNDGLYSGVTTYISWQQGKRMAQLLRAGGPIILVVLTLFLAVRHNINERRYESNMLISRGADENTVRNMVYKEIMILAALSTVLGLGLGAVLSRVGVMSTGYFSFRWDLFISEPFLISIESLALSAIVGILVPFGAIIAYDFVYKTRQRAEESTGKLAKVTRVLKFVKWDVLLVSLTGIALVALLGSGTSLQLDPMLRFFSSIILSFAPFALFLGIASLFIKALRAGATLISTRLEGFFGAIPSSVGIRRVGKAASSAGPVAMVLVLTISLAWSNAVIGASLPVTKLNQARFTFGADIRFDLDFLRSYQSVNSTEFIQNCTLNEAHVAGAELSITDLMLSTGYYDSADLVAMNPSDYLAVGYDYTGQPLNESPLSSMLLALESNPMGAIISQDIAEEYELAVGDSLRSYETGSGNVSVFTFTIIGVYEALTNALLFDTQGRPYSYYGAGFGLRTVWVNRGYLSQFMNFTTESRNMYAMRVTDASNTTQVALDILQAAGYQPQDTGSTDSTEDYADVDSEVRAYIGTTDYSMDRAVDTMLTIASTLVIFGAISIYAAEGLNARRREIALMRAMGADKKLIVKTQATELFVLTLASILLLLLFAPLLIATTGLTQQTSYILYPIRIFFAIPWGTLALVLSFFLVSVTLFVVAVSTLATRIRLAQSLNASWSEGGPMGGEM